MSNKLACRWRSCTTY